MTEREAIGCRSVAAKNTLEHMSFSKIMQKITLSHPSNNGSSNGSQNINS